MNQYERRDRTNLDQERLHRQRMLTWSIIAIAAVLIAIGIGAYMSHKRSQIAAIQENPAAVVAEQPAPVDSTISESNNPVTPSAEMPPESPQAEMVTVETFVQAPESHIGKNIRVRGKVDEILGPTAFIMHSDDTAPDQKFLVVLPTEATTTDTTLANLKIDQEVAVSASIAAFDPASAKNIAVGSDPIRLDTYQGKVMLISTSAAH